jgi:DNA-binding NarL/FixJ family response regulator
MPAPVPIRILFVGDHELVRKGIRSLLSVVPEWQVCAEAADGKEAIAKAVECKPDVVLMVISMPQMNGIEAARQIRSKLPSVKIVMLTMHDSTQISEQAVRAGANACVMKTASPEDLLQTITRVLQQTGSRSRAESRRTHEIPHGNRRSHRRVLEERLNAQGIFPAPGRSALL